MIAVWETLFSILDLLFDTFQVSLRALLSLLYNNTLFDRIIRMCNYFFAFV